MRPSPRARGLLVERETIPVSLIEGLCGAAESSSVTSQTPSGAAGFGSVKNAKIIFWGGLSLLDPEEEKILWH